MASSTDGKGGQLLDPVFFALDLAQRLHRGQPKKYAHAFRVALRVQKYKDPTTTTAAALHDTIEEGKATLDSLRQEGVDEPTVRALDLLSRRPQEPYKNYVRRILKSGNIPAIRVKIADLEDHLVNDPADDRTPMRRKAYKKLTRRAAELDHA